MVMVPAYHEVDAVLIKQRDPLLADTEVCTDVGRRNGNLVHAHHDPVDIMITTGRGQLLFQPGFLCWGGSLLAMGIPVDRPMIGGVSLLAMGIPLIDP